MNNPKQIIDDPNFLAYKMDFASESIEFLRVSRAELNAVTWLNKESFSSANEIVRISLADVINCISNQPNKEAKPPKFIFHTAYCASTFLSRCLAVSGSTVSLREPQLLLDAANAKRLSWRSQSTNMDYRHFPSLAIRLLQKHAQAHETLIIKPVNSVNNIVPELMLASGATKALMMYTDVRNFVLSTLKKGESAKQRQRSMFDLIRCDFPHLATLNVSDVIQLSDLKLSLTLWRLHIEQAQNILNTNNAGANIRSVYAEDLINNPAKMIVACNDFLELGLSKETIDEVVNGRLITHDAKDSDAEFSLDKRASQYKKIETFFQDDLNNGYQWMLANNPSTKLTPKLPQALIV